MKTETDAKLVTIYVNSSDHYHGRPMYAAIVNCVSVKASLALR